MQQTNAKPSRQLAWLEQVAVLATSMVWTAIVLLIISFVWAYQDAQARWEMLQPQPTPALVAMLPSATSTPTATPLPPTATATFTPAPTNTPSPTPTYVIGPAGVPPEILPETPLEGGGVPTSATGGETGTEPLPPTDTPVPPTNTPTPVSSPVPTHTPVPKSPPPPAAGGPDRVVVKSVGVDTPIVPVGWSVIEQNGQQYSIWDVADFAGGWHNTSAPPGQPGNTVLSGHHNIKGEVFRYLVDVQEGDEISLF